MSGSILIGCTAIDKMMLHKKMNTRLKLKLVISKFQDFFQIVPTNFCIGYLGKEMYIYILAFRYLIQNIY